MRHQVHPKQSTHSAPLKPAIHTSEDRSSHGKVTKEPSHARFAIGSEVSAERSLSKEEGTVVLSSGLPVTRQKRPLSTIASESGLEPDSYGGDLEEGGRDLDIPGHIRGSAALTSQELDKLEAEFKSE